MTKLESILIGSFHNFTETKSFKKSQYNDNFSTQDVFISYCKLILVIVNCNFYCIAGQLCCKLTLSVIIIIIIMNIIEKLTR